MDLSLRRHGRACGPRHCSRFSGVLPTLRRTCTFLIYGSPFPFSLHFSVPSQLVITHSFILVIGHFRGPFCRASFGSCIVIQIGRLPRLFLFLLCFLSSRIILFVVLLHTRCLLSTCSMDVFHTMYVCIL
jgi:hypothetical protein